MYSFTLLCSIKPFAKSQKTEKLTLKEAKLSLIFHFCMASLVKSDKNIRKEGVCIHLHCYAV